MNALADAPSAVEILPGFSPKPARTIPPSADTSPSPSDSGDPDTKPHGGPVEGPDLTIRRRVLANSAEFSVQGSIVTFD
jgi:hypothetical protein